VQSLLQAFMDSKTFIKICKACKAIDRTFTVNDADLIFARIVSKGQRRIGLEQFVSGLQMIAQKKGISLRALHAALSSLMGPTTYAAKAESIRLHVPTFQGQQGFAPVAHEVQLEKGDMNLERLFFAFTAFQPSMDGKTFVKLCHDCGLFGRDFAFADADVIFAKVVPKGQRRINLQQFEEALQSVAVKKHMDLVTIYELVSRLVGPVLNATQMERVRFYDDLPVEPRVKDDIRDGIRASRSYTPRRGRSMSPTARPSPQFDYNFEFAEDTRREDEATPSPSHPSMRRAFRSFCGSSHGMDGKNFAKLCKDAPLVDKGFTARDADIIFAKVVPHGTRRMNQDQFETALAMVAERKGLSSEVVCNIVAASSGPILQATRADSVRFHDDIHSHTFSSCRDLGF